MKNKTEIKKALKEFKELQRTSKFILETLIMFPQFTLSLSKEMGKEKFKTLFTGLSVLAAASSKATEYLKSQ